MGWKENQRKYIVEYTKSKYHRITIQFRIDGKKDVDSAIWNAVKDAPSKQEAVKQLAYKGLKQ